MQSNNKTEIGRVDPTPSTETDNPWGVVLTGPADVDNESVLEATAELGVSYSRLHHTQWREVELERGEYDWDRTDEEIEFLTQHNIEPFARIGHGNPAYNDAGIVKKGTAPPWREEASYSAWREFTQTLIERYRDDITYWELANEPNVGVFWHPEPDSVEYARFVDEAEELIHNVDPDAKIVAGSLAGLDTAFLREFLAAAGTDDFDVIAYHAYQTVPEAYLGRPNFRVRADIGGVELNMGKDKLRDLNFDSAFSEIEGLLRSRGFEGEIWQGESGYPSTEDTIHWRGDGPWGERIQAKVALRRFLTDWFAGAGVSTWHKIIESSTERGSWGFQSGKNTKGLLVLEDLRRKPAFDAIQHLCTVLDRISRADVESPSVEVRDPGGLGGQDISAEHQVMPPVVPDSDNRRGVKNSDIRAEAFYSASDSPAAVYWVPQTAAEEFRPATADLRVPDAPSDPVLVDLVDGTVYDPGTPTEEQGATVFEELPLTDYPFALVEREDVPLA